MSPITAWLLRGALALSLVTSVTGCSEAAPETQAVIRVEAALPAVRDLDITLRYPVEVEADESVAVTPVAISGFLRKVLVDVGDKVTAGQLIAMVDCREYTAQRTQAATSIAKWEAQVEESRNRYERMLEMGERVVAPAELDAALKEVRVAEAELADARAKLSEAGQRQGYCSLTAPFSGYVTERYLDAGAMVGPGGPPVVNIVKTKEVRIVTFVVEDDAPKVEKGAPVRIVLHAYPDTPFEAEVARLGRSLDPVTRTLRVEMTIPNVSDRLLPAMTGTASIVVDKREDALLLPSTAVLSLESVSYVYVVRDEDGQTHARRVPIETGLDFGDWIEVREGLEPDDRVIVVGRELVDDGTPVEAVDAGDEWTIPAIPGVHGKNPPDTETENTDAVDPPPAEPIASAQTELDAPGQGSDDGASPEATAARNGATEPETEAADRPPSKPQKNGARRTAPAKADASEPAPGSDQAGDRTDRSKPAPTDSSGGDSNGA